jgi:hypothetical protein
VIELRHAYAMVHEYSNSRHSMSEHLICWFYTRACLSPRLNIIGEVTSRVLAAGIDKLVP